VKVTGWPGVILPMSLSSRRQDLHLRQIVRDQERLGAERLAATVCPTSIARSTTSRRWASRCSCRKDFWRALSRLICADVRFAFAIA